MSAGGIGRSGGATPDKIEALRAFINLHAGVVERVWGNARGKSGLSRRYYYIETHCGNGTNEEHGPGSPIVFMDAMLQRSIDFRAYFIDEEPEHTERLSQCIDDDRVQVITSDNLAVIDRVLREIPRYAYGMVFIDPNGVPRPELLRAVKERRPLLDILLHCNSQGIKRARGRYPDSPRLTDVMKDEDGGPIKESWQVRAPLSRTFDRWEFAFVYGSNYPLQGWPAQSWYRIDKGRGKEIMQSLDCTDAEIDEIAQPRLFMRGAVAERSGGTCEVCRSHTATEMHHLHYGPDLDPAKLLHVCHHCHCLIEGKAS